MLEIGRLTIMDKSNKINFENEKVKEICEECKEYSKSVPSNLIMHGYKICDSCKTSKTIFPV